jgi:hypothetical protein
MNFSPGAPDVDHSLVAQVAQPRAVSLLDLPLGDGPGDYLVEDARRAVVHAVVAGTEPFDGGDDLADGHFFRAKGQAAVGDVHVQAGASERMVRCPRDTAKVFAGPAEGIDEDGPARQAAASGPAAADRVATRADVLAARAVIAALARHPLARGQYPSSTSHTSGENTPGGYSVGRES